MVSTEFLYSALPRRDIMRLRDNYIKFVLTRAGLQSRAFRAALGSLAGYARNALIIYYV